MAQASANAAVEFEDCCADPAGAQGGALDDEDASLRDVVGVAPRILHGGNGGCGSSGAAASRVYGAGAGKGKAVSDGPPRTAARQRGETSRIPGEAAGATRDGRRCVAENALQDGGRLGVGSGQC